MLKHYKTNELGYKIGGKLGKVIEVDTFIMKGKEPRLLKVKVDLDVTKPLRSSLKIVGQTKRWLNWG